MSTGLKRVRIGVGLAALLMSWGAPSVAQTPVRIADTDAAKAFLAGRYEVAADEFERLAHSNPENVLVLRYLAMSYDRAGRPSDAIRIFRRALDREPDNIALLYHSGAAYYNAHHAEEARRQFLRVVALGPGSEYERLARTYLDAIAQQTVSSQSPGAPRWLSLYFEVGYHREESDYAAADGLSRDVTRAGRMTEYLSAEIALVRRSDWLVSLDASGQGTQYVDADPGLRDIWQSGGGARIQYSGRLAGVPAVGTLKGFHQHVRFTEGVDYSHSAGGTLGLQLSLSRDSSTRGYYRCSADEYELDGFDARYSSRDAVAQSVGLDHTLYAWNRKVWLKLGVEYIENAAEGVNFDFTGPMAHALLSVPIAWNVRLDASLEFTVESYDEFAGPESRETERRTWSGTLWRWIGTGVMARLSYREIDEESNLPLFSSTRREFGASVAYVY